MTTGRRSGRNRGRISLLQRSDRASKVPFAVIGATALGARGLPRFTKDLDVVVTTDDAWEALDALESVGTGEIDLLVTSGEPESSVIAEATPAELFGVRVPVATLEQLVLMYLYSNQPRHLGDLARIVTESAVDLANDADGRRSVSSARAAEDALRSMEWSGRSRR